MSEIEYLTIQQVAEIQNVSERTIKRWDSEEKYPNAIGEGRNRRFPRTDVENFGKEPVALDARVEPSVRKENVELENEVAVAEERYELEQRLEAINVTKEGMTFEEYKAEKIKVVEDREKLAGQVKEYLDAKAIRTDRFKALAEEIDALKAEIKEKETIIANLTDAVGGMKKAEIILTEIQIAERDARDYPCIDNIPVAIRLLVRVEQFARQQGGYAESLSRNLRWWTAQFEKYATYQVVYPETNSQKDVDKAKDATERNKEGVRQNYAWAIAGIRTCSKNIMHTAERYQDATKDTDYCGKVCARLIKRDKELCELMGLVDKRDREPLPEKQPVKKKPVEGQITEKPVRSSEE